MSEGDAECRADVVARLEKLQYEVHIDCLYLSPINNTTGKFHVQGAPITDDWAFESRRELWRLSAPLVWKGHYDESETDDGLAQWLFGRAQQFVSPTGCSAHLANPIHEWTNGVRYPAEPRPDVACAVLVPGDPRLATEYDLSCVAAKASLLVGVFREQFEKLDQLEKSGYRPWERNRELTEGEARYEQMRRRELRWAQWNIAHWRIYADIVHHYASALLPDELSKSKQVARRAWLRRDEVDWAALEQELLLLSSRLQWLTPPAKSMSLNTDMDNLASQPRPDSTMVVTNRTKLRRALQSARDELVLARERAESFAELAVRTRRAVIQACNALHADVCLDVPTIPHSPFWELRKERPGELSDKAAFSWWLFDICSWVRSTSTVWPGGAGEYDFAPPLRNEAGKMIDKDGNELTPVQEADGSMHWSGEIVTQMQVENEADQKIRMQLRAKDWLDVIDRLLEMVDECSESNTVIPQVFPPSEVASVDTAIPNEKAEFVESDSLDDSVVPIDLLHELTTQQGKIVAHLWGAKHATKWQSLPDNCWRSGSTSDQEDRTIESALERLRDKLNLLPRFNLTLEVYSAKQTAKLVRNPPRK